MQPREIPWDSVWITGASSGIGLDLARRLDGRAGKVAISARSADRLRAIAADSRSMADHPLDITDADAVAATVERIEAESGPIDLAVLNAGSWTLLKPGEIDLDAMRSGMEVNYLGTVNCLAAIVPHMKARGRGHIAIVASVAGYRGLPRAAAYGPTKAALINLAESLKSELGPFGITVSIVNPGFVDTPLTRDNPFPMPALMDSGEAADRLLSGLIAGRYEIVFPRRFVFGIKLLRLLPNAIFFWLIQKFVHPGKTSP